MTPAADKSLVRWPHTGLDAPYRFTITDFAYHQLRDGVAFSASLVHPDLGPVGQIVNDGPGCPTSFRPASAKRFHPNELEQFLQRSLLDGAPIGHETGIESLLDAIITEAETEQTLATARSNRQFVVRSSQPDDVSAWDLRAGVPIPLPLSIVGRIHRAELIAKLPTFDTLPAGAHWQIYDGEMWTPLLESSPLSIEQAAARLHRIAELIADLGQQEGTTAVPFDDSLFLHSRNDFVTLTSDTCDHVDTMTWCRCTARSRRVVAFERWQQGTLQMSGVVHAAKKCRALMRID